MKYLVPEYWGNFKKDGVLFETLIGQILCAKYPGIVFTHTGGPHDGGKDFQAHICKPDKNIGLWAECKYHQKPLPIHDVSMSMTMAIIEKVNKIIFFSYSPVNRNFNKYIAQYKETTNMEVEVYSDVTLESLIFSLRKDIDFDSFFPNYIDDRNIECSNSALKISYTVRKSKHNLINKKVQINDIITTELYLTNDTDNDIDAEIVLRTEDIPVSLSLMNNDMKNGEFKIQKCIPLHSSELVTISFRVDNFSEYITLPQIIIIENKLQKIKKTIQQKFECLWLAETKLIGEQYTKYIDCCNDYMMSAKGINLFGISGSSGCGKSRLLKEIKFLCLSHNKTIVEIDSDKNVLSAKLFLQQIVSVLENLPIFSQKLYKKINTITHQDNTENLYSLHILYDKNFNPASEKDLVVKYLFELLRSKGCFLLLDNVQNYDELIVTIVEDVINLSWNNEQSFGIVFSFNSDYLYKNTKPYLLYRKIKTWHTTKTDSVFCRHIDGFKKNDAKEYLNSCLCLEPTTDKSDVINYQLCIDKIVEIHGHNPFFLKNYILYLYQSNILKKTTSTGFYIHDIASFQKNIKSIPDAVLSLIEDRESIMYSNFFDSDEYREKYIYFVTLLSFVKEMPNSLYSRIIDNTYFKNVMEQIGFIKTNDNGNLIFEHNYFYDFFKKKYVYSYLQNAELQLFIEQTKKLYLSSKMQCQVFIAKYLTNSLNDSDIKNMLSKICSNDVEFDYCNTIFDIATSILLERPELIKLSEYIEVYNSITNMTLNRFGIQSCLKYHKLIYEYFLLNPPIFEHHLLQLFTILAEHITHLMGQRRSKESLEINQKIISVLENFFEQNSEYCLVMTKLYNFKTNAYNQLNMLEDAINSNKTALIWAEKSGDKAVLIITKKTMGDIYYALDSACEYSSIIVQCWLDAYDTYVKHYENENNLHVDLALKITAYIKGAMANMISRDFEAAKKKLDILSAYLDRTNMMYFEEKIRLVTAAYQILSKTVDDYGIKLIKQAIDICALYGNNVSYIDSFHILAVAFRFLKKYDFSYENYWRAFSVIMLDASTELDQKYYKFFFMDMVIALKQMKKNDNLIYKSVLNQIIDKDLQNELINILNLSEDDFSAFLKNHAQLTPLYEPEYKLNFPKI